MKTSSEVPPRVLLDTHTLLWALTTPERLPARVRATLESRRTELVVSAVSAWEVATKHRVGKLPDGAMLVGGWSRFLAQLGARELPVSGDHGLLGGSSSGRTEIRSIACLPPRRSLRAYRWSPATAASRARPGSPFSGDAPTWVRRGTAAQARR